jgi:hypothetical protein
MLVPFQHAFSGAPGALRGVMHAADDLEAVVVERVATIQSRIMLRVISA